MQLKNLLFSFVLFVFFAASHAWDSGFVSNSRNGGKRYTPSPMACNHFPQLGTIPSNYRPLSQLVQDFSQNISRIVSDTQVPSITVNLIYDQDILWTKGFGSKNLSNRAAGAPNGDTMYRIGSITKLFTMLLAEIAQDAGYFTLNDEVAKYVPQFAPINPFPSTKKITFAQLGSHMSGLQSASPCGAVMGQCAFSNAQMWNKIKTIPLVNPPGLIPQYTNLGFSVLGHATEEIMGSQWGTLVQTKILDPLGMTRSGPAPDSKFASGSAVGYGPDGLAANRMLDIGWDGPAGSMYSTTNDLAKLASLYFRDDAAYKRNTNQILDGQSLREQRQPRYINNDLTGYGLAWEIINSPDFYTKGGSIDGYLSFLATVPSIKLGMVILQSSDSSPAMQEIIDLFISNVMPAFTNILNNISPAPYIPSVFRNQLTGTYTWVGGDTAKFSIQQAARYPVMVIELPGGLTLLLDYVSDYQYKISTRGAPLDCDSAQSGLEEYIFFTPGRTITYTVPGLVYGFVGSKISN